MFASYFSKVGIKLIAIGLLVAAIFTYRGLYHHEQAKLVAVKVQLAALQAGYKEEVDAVNTCSQATADAHAQLVAKQVQVDAARNEATKSIEASTTKSVEIIKTVDTGKSCEKAVSDFVSSFQRSH